MLIDLLSREWKLQGWRPFYWQLRRSLETGGIFAPEFGPYPAILPGSAHTALLKAAVIPDWNIGRRSLESEWVEHRQWEFFTDFAAGELAEGEALVLQADGLDYSGWILVDTEVVATFRGALIRHRFDLSRSLGDGKAHRLSIIFDLPPEEQGQIGRTPQSRFFKPRYNFSWDWCIRLVPTGIWDCLSLVLDPNPLEVVSVMTDTRSNLKAGEVITRFHHQGAQKSRVQLRLRSPDGTISATKTVTIAPGECSIRLGLRAPQLWWPNGAGKASLYEFEITDLRRNERLLSRKVGFKHVRWLPCEGAPAGARPLICEVNGRSIFLQGVNWTPVRMDYPATKDAAYRRLTELYAAMGCNVLRVWGGGCLEREIFYQYCDELGLMVWQEFPLSSSGLDSEAPTDPAAVAELRRIATDYIRRRSHHASLLVWCGGNELQHPPKGPDDTPAPLDETHPTLSALLEVVNREQPGIRFFPTSPSGPVFYAHREAMGKGLHHHVHGPWDQTTSEDIWRDYWLHDDSLLRAETGVAGASSLSLLRQYAGAEKIWPPTFDNLWWRHSAAWWVQWELFRKSLEKLPADKRLKRYVQLSQKRQAEFLALAANSCKARFPRCAGFIIWMGHDSFPCPSNTALINFDLKPKPAYHAVADIFLSDPK